ncbi:TonB-dependent siderophore receptor [Gloeobacter violaceus]|nr:TonB-dependent siderophore receptor [Gloeobacter violaceus]
MERALSNVRRGSLAVLIGVLCVSGRSLAAPVAPPAGSDAVMRRAELPPVATEARFLAQQEPLVPVTPTAQTPDPEKPAPSPQQEEELEEVTVQGTRSYRVKRSSTATKTDTDVMDVPQSIQIVPQQVLLDQNVNTLTEALRNVASVTTEFRDGTGADFYAARGFQIGADNIRLDGFRTSTRTELYNVGIEQVEVLKGPSAVLYGDMEPGGLINLVSKKPQPVPFGTVALNVGSYGNVWTTLDTTGPLNAAKTLTYRLSTRQESANSFRDLVNGNKFFVAPALSWQISERLRWDLRVGYQYLFRVSEFGLIAPTREFSSVNTLPLNRFYGEPSDNVTSYQTNVTSTLEYKFGDDWTLRNLLGYSGYRVIWQPTQPLAVLEDGRTLERNQFVFDETTERYNAELNLTGRFATGAVRHQLFAGIDYTRSSRPSVFLDGPTTPIDLYNPVYTNPPRSLQPTSGSASDSSEFNNRFGISLQDQIDLGDNFKLLLGGRYSFYDAGRYQELPPQAPTFNNAQRFSPRVGAVWRPTDWLSLYASYSDAFTPASGRSATGQLFKPITGTQYEVGAKAELFGGGLLATVALYELTKQNVLTRDPDNPQFSIQTGEVQSKGFEVDLSGRPLPGWDIYASYAYVDARFTRDNVIAPGTEVGGVPRNTLSLWSKYEFGGDLRGLSVGAGLYWSDNRWNVFSTANLFQVPGYTTFDAMVAYRFDPRWKVQVNLKNLFNRRYYTDSDDSLVFIPPGAPTTVDVSLSYTF